MTKEKTMNTQIHTQFAPACCLEFVVLDEDPSTEPQQYTAYDFGYELGADEVGQAMTAEYSNGSFDLAPQVEPAEFETSNSWFLS
jgi:hypothetical protein